MMSARIRRAFSLVELITAIVVLGVVAAVLLPILGGAVDGFSAAANLREGSERAGYAMDRCLQTLREAPPGATAGTLDIATAEVSKVIFVDGHGLEMSEGVLYLCDTSTDKSVLCRNVTEFVISYVASDGKTDSMSQASNTQRFVVKITAGGVSLTGAAFPRVGVVPS